jgi:hypothetical protein
LANADALSCSFLIRRDRSLRDRIRRFVCGRASWSSGARGDRNLFRSVGRVGDGLKGRCGGRGIHLSKKRQYDAQGGFKKQLKGHEDR